MTAPTIGFLVRSTAWGGAERHTVAVARSVAERGHPVVIVQLGHELFTRHADLPTNGGIRLVSEPAGRTFSVLGWRKLLRTQRVRRAVLVKGIFGVRWTALDLAVLVGRTPMVTIEHQYPDPNLIPRSSGILLRRERAVLALHRAAARRVVAVSDAIGRRLVESYGFDPGRVSVVSNGVDPVRFVPDDARRARARARWGVRDNALVFGFLGRLSVEKRIDRLLEAFRRVRDSTSGPEPVLVVVGSGPAEANLRRLADELGISASCRWAGVTTAAWDDYPGFNVFALASDRERLPPTVLEAMSCGLPVVAVDIPGTRQMVMEGETGIIAARTPESLASAMLAMANAPGEIRRAWGAGAREHVLEHHDARKTADAVASIALGG